MHQMLIDHNDIGYSELIAHLVKARAARTYFEIGVCHGQNLASISCDVAIAVDPFFLINHNVAMGKKELYLFQYPSDSFFERGILKNIAPNGVNFAFLDGMHVFEFLLRDFYKTERHSCKNSLIALHDCLPVNAEMAERVHKPEARQDLPHAGWWTGDVWKLIPILKKYRPDLSIKATRSPPTGLLFVTNLDPNSDVLEKNYLQIISEFKDIENSSENIRAAIDQVEFIDSQALLGLDHTLYFSL
ncbi:hypothetical protein A1351_17605 [Methylosinus sp. R-45379]|uniref:hypothetical protein n=1 Tax=unclassified Methylosinus TaxID=2624500 RepID=UPI0004B30CF6|nr:MULTISPECIES: hypothetical protein [unclassified Methylosinus]OAI24575.1 hypothetical protein A1351_17605 [Methylosinus sp. R-45379]